MDEISALAVTIALIAIGYSLWVIRTRSKLDGLHVSDADIRIEDSGGNSISIDTASGDITIASTGTITLKSATVELEAESTLSLEAGGTLTVKGALVKIN